MLLCFFFVFFSVGEGMGEGDLVVMLGALSVAREGRVPLVLVLLAVFALAYVDVAAKIALDRAVAGVRPGDSDATAITLVGLEAYVHARRDGQGPGTNWIRITRRAMPLVTCVEIKILRRVRAESSRRPPRHRHDACSMAWRCRLLTGSTEPARPRHHREMTS